MKKLLACWFLLTLFFSIGSIEVQIGTGTDYNRYVPLIPLYSYSMSQTIYYQSYIDVEDKLISSLSYYYLGSNDGNWTDSHIKLYLGHTDKTTFENNEDWISGDELCLVYEGPVTFIDNAWSPIIFDTPFPYNNQDHLVVAIETDSEGFEPFYYHNFVCTENVSYFNRCLSHCSDTINGDFHNPPTGTIQEDLPNIKLNFIDYEDETNIYTYPSTYSWGDIMYNGYISPLSVATLTHGFNDLAISNIYFTGDEGFSINNQDTFPIDVSNVDFTASIDFLPQSPGNYNSTLNIEFTNNQSKSIDLTANVLDGTIYDDVYVQNFDNSISGSLPQFWKADIVSSFFKTNVAVSNNELYENKSLQFQKIYAYDNDAYMYLFSPPVNNLSNKRIRFIAKSDNTFTNLVIGTADKNHGDFVFTPRETFNTFVDYQEYFHSFSDLANEDEYIVLKYETTDIGLTRVITMETIIDNIYIETFSDYPIINIEKRAGTTPLYRYSYSCGSTPLNRAGVTHLKIRNSGFTNLVTNFTSELNDFQISDEEIIIPPQDMRIVKISFEPSEIGLAQESFMIESNDLTNPQITINLSGTGIEADPFNVTTTGSPSTMVSDELNGMVYIQSLYYADELAMNSTMIEQIAFDYGGEDEWDIENIRIFMGNTEKDYFENADDWIDSNELVEVYDGSLYQGTNAGWKNLNLDNPFPYDNTKNLVVALYYYDQGPSLPFHNSWIISDNNNLVKSLCYQVFTYGDFNFTELEQANYARSTTFNQRFRYASIPTTPQIVVNPFNGDFENTEADQSSEERFITVRSVGQQTAQITSPPVITGGDAEHFTITTDFQIYPIILPYNERVNYGISFTPSSEGYKEAILQIFSNNNDVIEINLSGTALASTNNDDSELVPLINKLGNNYPNPFNPRTIINYSITKSGSVKVSIYNIKGQIVRTLVNDNKEAGRYSAVWNGKDNNNKDVASGLYLYRIESLDFSATKKMMLMK